MNSALNWVVNYSSVIQTLCSVLGLILAICALIFAIHQIRIAQEQRFHALKMQHLSSLHETIYSAKKAKLKIQNINNDLFDILMSDIEISLFEQVNETISTNKRFSETFDFAETICSELLAMFKDSKNEITISKLENVSDARVDLIHSLLQCELHLENSINNFKKEFPSFNIRTWE